MTPIDRLIALADGQVFVRHWPVAGSTLAPIVLLHDSLGCVALWRDFPAQLAAASGRDVIAYDRLGYGQSSPRLAPAQPDFIEQEANTLLPALLAALGLTRYVLFGHSVGGGMALTHAAQAAGCVAVVSESAQAFVEPRTREGIVAAKAGFAEAAQFARLTRWHGERARWVLDAWTETWLLPLFDDWSLSPWLARVRCPVLAIHGDQDEFGSHAFPRRIAAEVAGPSQLLLLDHCGHVPHRELPQAVLAGVYGFLQQHGVR